MARHLLSKDGHLVFKDGHLVWWDPMGGYPCDCCSTAHWVYFNDYGGFYVDRTKDTPSPSAPTIQNLYNASSSGNPRGLAIHSPNGVVYFTEQFSYPGTTMISQCNLDGSGYANVLASSSIGTGFTYWPALAVDETNDLLFFLVNPGTGNSQIWSCDLSGGTVTLLGPSSPANVQTGNHINGFELMPDGPNSLLYFAWQDTITTAFSSYLKIFSIPSSGSTTATLLYTSPINTYANVYLALDRVNQNFYMSGANKLYVSPVSAISWTDITTPTGMFGAATWPQTAIAIDVPRNQVLGWNSSSDSILYTTLAGGVGPTLLDAVGPAVIERIACYNNMGQVSPTPINP